MLTPEYLLEISEKITPKIRRIEDQTIQKIAKRIKRGVTPDYELGLMLRIGYEAKDIQKALEKELGHITKEMQSIINEGIKQAYDNDVKLYKEGGKQLNNPQVIKQMEIYAERSLNKFKNLTRNTGTVHQGVFKPIDVYVQNVIDESLLSVSSGLFDYTTAITRSLRQLGNEGIRFMHYESGRRISIEAAVRSNILTTLSQVTGKMSEINADEMGQDLMMITAHLGARPTHAVWQGEVVSRSGQRGYLSVDDIGYGDVEGFKGANCRHDWYPYFEGISQPIKIPEEPEPIEYLGKERTYYECTQIQRRMERQMRQTIRKKKAFEAVNDKTNVAIEKARLRDQKKKYEAFSKKAKLHTQYERLVTS